MQSGVPVWPQCKTLNNLIFDSRGTFILYFIGNLLFPRPHLSSHSTMSVTATQTQPDISYHPDFEKYQLRSARIKAQLPSDSELLQGFPEQLTGPIVWEGEDFENEDDWTLALNAEQLEEIHGALEHFNVSCYTSK